MAPNLAPGSYPAVSARATPVVLVLADLLDHAERLLECSR
jgi:hypothetical protein